MLGLVAGQHGAVVGQLLAHGHHLLPQQGVLLLQEGRPHRYLVLLKPPGVAGPLGCLVILVPPTPVLLVLGVQRWKSTEVQRGPQPQRKKKGGAALLVPSRTGGNLKELHAAASQQWSLKATGSPLRWVSKGLPL